MEDKSDTENTDGEAYTNHELLAKRNPGKTL